MSQLPELARLVVDRLLEPELGFVDAVARRMLELIDEDDGRPDIESTPGELVDAAELARRLGLGRQFVYRHAEALGAEKFGDGPRPRLRFDPVRARAAAAELRSGR